VPNKKKSLTDMKKIAEDSMRLKGAASEAAEGFSYEAGGEFFEMPKFGKYVIEHGHASAEERIAEALSDKKRRLNKAISDKKKRLGISYGLYEESSPPEWLNDEEVQEDSAPEQPRAPKWIPAARPVGDHEVKRISVKSARCKFCRKVVRFSASEGQPENCPFCGKSRNDEAEFIVEHLEEGKPSDHFQVRWLCRNCGTTGVSWMNKGSRASDFSCPKCNSGSRQIMMSKISATGECSSAWRDSGRVERPKPARKKHTCPECGYISYYLVKPLSKCPDCGYY
jgi:ssDNA-binding Zn-finger/Zn-ribbon topoisomerase 1